MPDADGTRLVPLYGVITQLGLDLQYTADAWLGKLEAIGRHGHGDDFGALVTGIEYTLYRLLGGDADLGLLAEYLHDGRDERGAPATPFEDDLFVGARLALNDISDTAVLAGGVIDLDGDGAVLRVEAERRLGDGWKLELEGQAFVDADGPSAAFDDDFVTARLTRFF